MDKDKGAGIPPRVSIVLHADRPRQALILEWLQGICGNAGRFYGLTPKLEAALFLYRAWSIGQVKIIPVAGIPDAVLTMMSDLGISMSTQADSHNMAATGSPNQAAPDYGMDLRVPDGPGNQTNPGQPISREPEKNDTQPGNAAGHESGGGAPAIEDESPLAQLAKQTKW